MSHSFSSKTFSYLALGDSYTIGESVLTAESYPYQLAAQLAAQSIHLSPITVIAQTGWTTDELQKGIELASITHDTYDLVSLLIGVNNQYRGRSLEEYKADFKHLLNEAVRYAQGRKDRVFVLSIPDYAYTPFGKGDAHISQGIDDYNAVNRQITEEMGIMYYDITPISRNGLNDTSLVAQDELHPSGQQYRLWADMIAPSLLEILQG